MRARRRFRPLGGSWPRRPAIARARFQKLAEFYPSPGFLAEKMTIYLATGLTEGKQTPMEDERIQTRWFTAKEIDGLIRSYKILDAKTQIGFLKWKRYFGGK